MCAVKIFLSPICLINGIHIILDGSAFYSTQKVFFKVTYLCLSSDDSVKGSAVTYQTGADVVVRAQFIGNGKLTNGQNTTFRAVQDDWPVFAFSHDLGSVKSSTSPIVIAIGHVRDPAVQYIAANGVLRDRSSYFFSNFTTMSDAVRPRFILCLVSSSCIHNYYRYLLSWRITAMLWKEPTSLMLKLMQMLQRFPLIMPALWLCLFDKCLELQRSLCLRTTMVPITRVMCWYS